MSYNKIAFKALSAANIKKTSLASSLSLIFGGLAAPSALAALPTGATLDFTLGTQQTVSCNYGTTPPCNKASYANTDIVGSYFVMDQNGNGPEPNEKTPIGSVTNGGLVIGTTQGASGSHTGGINGSESPAIDNPWTFFGGTGMHQTTSTVDDLGGNILDFSGWNVTWNGIASIPLTEQGNTTITCSDTSCTDGASYTLDGTFHVTGAGFTTVAYFLHMEGGVTLPGASLPPPAASVLPTSRSVQVGNTATAFAVMINSGGTTATDCGITAPPGVQANFSYQTTDASNALIGTPDTPVDIAAGGNQNYLFALTPTAAFNPVDVQLNFDCTNTDPAAVTVGLNTLLLTADTNPVPDIVALAATPTADGIVSLESNSGVFSVATVNVGVTGDITVSADTGGASLPVSIALCETNPGDGICINPVVPTTGTVTTTIANGTTPTFAFFVTSTDNVPFDPANNRIFVRFNDGGGVTRGSTSVAVRTL